MDNKEKHKVKCAVCGGTYTMRIPNNGDGSMWLPRRHKVGGISCPGNILETNILIKTAKPLDK